MKRLVLCGVLLCLLSGQLAAQSKSSFAGTSYTGGTLCQTASVDPIAECPGQNWSINIGSDIAFTGAAGSSAHDEYGFLQAGANAVTVCHLAPCVAGAAAGGGGAQASFTDVFTFPGLRPNTPYFLKLVMTLIGSVTGSFLNGVSSAELTASADLTNVVTPIPIVSLDCSSNLPPGGIRQSCSTKIQIFQGDAVNLHGILGVGANAVVPDSTSPISQQVSISLSGKGEGASYALVVVDAKGRKVSKAEGVIISASGTAYPTH